MFTAPIPFPKKDKTEYDEQPRHGKRAFITDYVFPL